MAAENSDRKHVSSIEDFFGYIRAEVSHDFFICSFFPFFGVFMSVVYPISELLEYFLGQATTSILLYKFAEENIKFFSFIFF